MPIPNAALGRSAKRIALTLAILSISSLSTACSTDTKADELAKLPPFKLSDAPTLTLTDDGTAQRTWTRISARRLPNGDIAISDEPALNIRVYNQRGEFLKEITHRGSGPGEMDQMFRLSSIGDTLFALPKPMVMPVSIFVADKGFIESYKPKVSGFEEKMTAFARMTNERWVVRQGAGFRRLTSPPAIGALMSDTTTLGIVERRGTDSSTVVWLPPVITSWSIGVPMSNPVPYPVMPTSFPLKPAMLYAVSGSQVWFVDAGTGAITTYDSTGAIHVQRTLTLAAKPFVVAEVSAAKAAELQPAQPPFARDMINGRYDPKFTPALMPLFSAIHAGENGEVWLQRYEISPTASLELIALSADGKPLGTLTLPAGLRTQQIGREYVLALKTDDEGLESIVEYAITRK